MRIVHIRHIKCYDAKPYSWETFALPTAFIRGGERPISSGGNIDICVSKIKEYWPKGSLLDLGEGRGQ